MNTYRFKTKISKTGKIKVPDSLALQDKEVEVTIVPKAHQYRKKLKAKDFVDKWTGFIQSSDLEDSRYDYLMKKYK